MKPSRQPLIYITVFLLLTLFFSLNVKSASIPTLKWSPQVVFKLPAYNTVVRFNDWAYFSSFEWNKWQASKVSFYNLLVGSGDSISKIGFASPDTNIAILSANSESVKLNLAETEKTVYIYDIDVKTVRIGGNYFTKDSYYTSFSEWQACNGDGVFQNETLTAIKAGSSTTVTLGFKNPNPQNAQLLFPSGSSLAFQSDINSNLILQVINGALNSSEFDVKINNGGGSFQFTSEKNTRIKIIYSDGEVKVSGDQGNPPRFIESGSEIKINAGDSVHITWDRGIEPLLPMMFVFGMVGLGAMIVGPLYAINKIKNREYLEALKTGTVVTVIGIALFIAWLWPA